MPIEYQMKYLYETIVESISTYCQHNFSASWVYGIENVILSKIIDDNYDPELNFQFKLYQIHAMNQLVLHGLWIKWSDVYNKPVLSPDPFYTVKLWNENISIPCGAD